MNNQLITGPSQHFLYRADGNLDNSPVRVAAADVVGLNAGPLSLTLSHEAARELAAHLAAAADAVKAVVQGGAA